MRVSLACEGFTAVVGPWRCLISKFISLLPCVPIFVPITFKFAQEDIARLFEKEDENPLKMKTSDPIPTPDVRDVKGYSLGARHDFNRPFYLISTSARTCFFLCLVELW